MWQSTSVVLSGNTLTLNLAMTFKAAYAGAKNIYMYAADVSGSNTGWHATGHLDGARRGRAHRRRFR